MRKTKIAIGIMALLLLATACTNIDDEATTAEPCQIAIAVDAATLTTRTAVSDPDGNLRGKQHVTRVQLYIYKADGDDFTCVASEDVGWRHLEGAADGLETRRQNYTTEYQDYEDGTSYLFLAMGFDDTYTETGAWNNANSVEAYGEPSKVATVGKKLSEENFKLQDGKSVSLIAQSELFAGSQTFTKAQLKDGTAAMLPIDLYRRVAGIVGYFKGLPSSVSKVELRLYASQNTATHFLPKLPTGYDTPDAVHDDEYVDYIALPYSDETTGSIVASYTVDENADGTFSLSAYVLPIAASTEKGKSTVELAMLSADGTVIAKRKILYSSATTRSGTGIIDTEEEETADSKAMHYPLRSNHFYRMGESTAPIDLSGQSSVIYIEIDPVWDEYYGGAMDNDDYSPTDGSIGIDKAWGEHEGGSLE